MRLLKPWQNSPVMTLVQKLAERILKRTCQMVGLVVSLIWGTIALTATAATAGVALHKEIQTAEFIRD